MAPHTIAVAGKGGVGKTTTCGMLIDTTGDCDVLRRGGVPTVAGDNFFSYFGKLISLDNCRRAVESGDIRLAFQNCAGGSINLFGDGQPADVPRWSGLTVEEVTEYLTGAGEYKARLTDGTNYSDYCYFEVVNTNVTASLDGNNLTVNFSSSNASPRCVKHPLITQITASAPARFA